MSEQITISFVGTKELKDLLERWAQENERSLSYIMRQILKQEAQRREQVQPKQQAVNQQVH